MRLLLDTHTLIWADSDPQSLSDAAAAAIREPTNSVVLSVVNLWEIQVKVAIGKMALRAPLAQILDDQRANGVAVLDVTAAHVLALGALPLHHRDPFDRMLAAQAVAEGAALVTRDAAFGAYPIRTLW